MIDVSVDAMASPARISTLLRGVDEAVLTVSGGVDTLDTTRITVVLRALLEAGARRLLVDLSHAEILDHSLEAVLARKSRRVRAAGGWLMVDRAPSLAGDDHTSLVDIFEIYRQARTPESPGGARGHGRVS